MGSILKISKTNLSNLRNLSNLNSKNLSNYILRNLSTIFCKFIRTKKKHYKRLRSTRSILMTKRNDRTLALLHHLTHCIFSLTHCILRIASYTLHLKHLTSNIVSNNVRVEFYDTTDGHAERCFLVLTLT